MDKIYDLLKTDKKIGLFESPTGTVSNHFGLIFLLQGKTMSLICSIMTWYLNKQPYQEDKLKNSLPASDDDFLSLFGGVTDSTA